MDKEQQIRLDFLGEAEAYFDEMESTILGLTNTELNSQQVDIVLRLAHSIKGGAAMMNFITLSQIAHQLEDFLKILRVRYTNSQIASEIETLLLQGVDCLREVSKLNRQGIEIVAPDFDSRIELVFGQLRQHLGDLEPGDEDALMAQDEDVDPALLVFEEGVNIVLDLLEDKLPKLQNTDLTQELTTTAKELHDFGKMLQLEPFMQLCQSIQNQVATTPPVKMLSLADRALKTWRQSYALVLRGSIAKLPSDLATSDSREQNGNKITQSQSQSQEMTTDNLLVEEFDPLSSNDWELGDLQSAFDETETESQEEFDPLSSDDWELSDLQSAFDETENTREVEFAPFANDDLLLDLEKARITEPTIELNSQESIFALPIRETSLPDKMVRVPASQLKQFNHLFEQLVLNRNTINLRLQQLQSVVTLLNQRMSQIESSNTQLKQWYNRALIGGLLNNQQKLESNLVSPLPQNKGAMRDRFDTLEMDRYSDIHLICQEQIETIVQLQEVSSDIKLGLREMNQAVRDLNYTTRSMQGNVNNTQMLPFSETVKRLPRLIRELNLQFNKQVNLKIIGGNTLLDRSVIEAINDPLIHLLRNAFDHGIENRATRIAAGKSPSGTITIQAKNQGTMTIITIADDGGGIALDRVRERVVKMGIPDTEISKISEAELLEFIFEPGFSTASEVTELSGRGVGMDVVKTNLQEVRGNVQVATTLGKGTTFTLKFPFTLSILRVAVMEQAGIIFAIPASSIRELIPLKSSSKYIVWNQTKLPIIEIENTLVYRRSRRTISLTGDPVVDRTMAVIIGDKKPLAAMQISRFWYEQESTIRAIDSLLPLPPGIISSVVFGDGKVIPLIEPVALIKECFKNKSTPNQSSHQLTKTDDLSTMKTILVVDDSVNIRRYLSLTLEKANYRVEQAKDGQEAIVKLADGLSVAAIICDIEMPRLDGYGVLEEIKTKTEFAHLPIIMLTSRSNEKHRKLAMNLGASAYLSKPYNDQELLKQLEELLNIAASK